MKSHFNRWCEEWGRVGIMHARRTAIGLKPDWERRLLIHRIVWGAAEFPSDFPVDMELLIKLAHAGCLK